MDQTISLLGPNHHDPRIQPNGKVIFALKQQFQAYSKADPPATQVDPLPQGLIELGVQLCRASATACDRCIADMITIDFFFLCRPGEHTITYDNEPFKLSNVNFYLLDQPFPLDSPLLQQSDFMTLTFDTQKDGTKGGKIGHDGCSTSTTFCPIHAVALWVQHLLAHGACSHQPLCSYFDDAGNRFHYIESPDITTILRLATNHPTKVECRSLRTSGAMALFSRGVNGLLIKLIGRYRFDAMIRYLHVETRPVIAGLSQLMLAGGDYQLLQEIATMHLPNPTNTTASMA